ncbi:MAG: type II secretion system protein [Kosmotogaceae bacterium]
MKAGKKGFTLIETVIVLAILTVFVTFGVSMMLQYKRLSLSAARVSEISAVKNLVNDYIRHDSNLKDAINSNNLTTYFEDRLKPALESRVEESGYDDIIIKGTPDGTISGSELNLATVHVLLEDTKSGKEEDVYVVIFTK